MDSAKAVELKAKDSEPVLGKEGHQRYRSGVGSLLYLLKHSRPELSNPIRELTRMMSAPTEFHNKEMNRVIRWVLDTPNIGLKMDPKIDLDEDGKVIWKMSGICDATWGSSKEDGRSVSGYILYFMGVPISFKSKQQPLVTLSSCEAEYVGISELVKEILFAKQLLEDFGLELKLPVKVFVDNQSAIQMVRNNRSGAGTKHVNCRYHFVRELVADGMIEILFIRTKDNTSDILTKNCPKNIFERHEEKLVAEVPEELLDR